MERRVAAVGDDEPARIPRDRLVRVVGREPVPVAVGEAVPDATGVDLLADGHGGAGDRGGDGAPGHVVARHGEAAADAGGFRGLRAHRDGQRCQQRGSSAQSVFGHERDGGDQW